MILNSAADPKGGGQDARNKGLPTCAAYGFLKIAAFCKARPDSVPWVRERHIRVPLLAPAQQASNDIPVI